MAELTVDLLLEDRRFKKSLDDAVKRANSSGKKIGTGITKPVESSFKEIAAIAKGFIVGNVLLRLPQLLTNSFRSVTNAAIAQEDAVNSLNAALKRTGNFSENASVDLRRFASELQRQSVIGDEVILKQISYAKSLGLTNKQTKEFVTAALNASAALDKDFNGTLFQLLKTLSGLQGELGESIPAIRTLTAEQLKAGEAAKFVNAQFSGAFTSQTNTTRGRISQLSNSFGDFVEKLGDFIIESKSYTSTLRNLTRAFNDLNSSLSDDTAEKLRLAKAEFSDLDREILQLQDTLNKTSDPVFIRDARVKLGFLKKDFKEAAALVKSLQKQVSEEAPDGEEPIIALLSEKEVLAAQNAFKTIGLTQIQQIKLVEAEQLAALDKARAFNDERILTEEDYQRRRVEVQRQASEQIKAIVKQEQDDIIPLVNRIQNFFVTAAQTAQAGFANAVGGAFAAFGKALATGENGLKAFVDAFLASIGQMAIQQGTSFILQGIGYQFVPGLQGTGTALIGAGAALATFGGALSAVSGGSGGSIAAGGGAGFAPNEFQPSQDLRSDLVTEERLAPETRVQVTIQGDVFDSDETGLRITKILENASLNENVRIVGGIA